MENSQTRRVFLDILKIIWYILDMICKICKDSFTPDKYHPRQQVCLRRECQNARQLNNIRDWRLRNPDYFKCSGQPSVWQANRHRYSKLWRITHKEYQKEYENSHKEQRKTYMREYMRQRRTLLNVNRNKS
jgi:hypothetical protein